MSNFVRWLQLKNYQYEVTFSLYMLTPTEKWIFSMSSFQSLENTSLNYDELTEPTHTDSIIFILLSLLVTAATLYLPDHILTIYNRVWYYTNGEMYNGSAGTAGRASVAKAMTEVATATADAVKRRVGEL